MINKKILGLAGLASLGLATTAPLAVVHAETASEIKSKATITFKENTEGENSVLNPNNPINEDGSKNIITPDDSTEATGTTLRIDYASSFNFDNGNESNKISTSTQKYKATLPTYSGQESPNFVQVTDARSGDAKGWKLSVQQMGQFKNGDSELKGATITINDGTYASGNESGFDNSTNPETSTNPVTISLHEGTPLMTAKAGQGRGTSLYTMKNVELSVPGSTVKEEGTYTTTLKWTLSDTAVE
ncbi:WxL domain-containing protein [Leuconostoc mesenteroides]|uniref:WxL domain-containing protein n=1 Tax=Leuconostoc mesenteroides TaxID=1245 RepID=UPI000761D26C|nr:WxL domain-containing protein [Leuconostoc mesenteroides]